MGDHLLAASVLAAVWLVPGLMLLRAIPLWTAVEPVARVPVAAVLTLAVAIPGGAAYLVRPVVGQWAIPATLGLVTLVCAARIWQQRRVDARVQARPGISGAGVAWALSTISVGVLTLAVGSRVTDDSAYHLGILHRLLAAPQLGLDVTSRFVDGTFNPTYALPLWHQILALAARISGAGPDATFVAATAVVSPVALLAWAAVAGRFVGSAATIPGAVAFLLTHLLFMGGDLDLARSIVYPGFVVLYVVLPVVFLLFLDACWGRSPIAARLALGAAIGTIGVLHANYLLYAALAFLGYATFWAAALLRPAHRSAANITAHLWTAVTAVGATTLTLAAVMPAMRGLAHFGQGTSGLADEWARYGGRVFAGDASSFHLDAGQLVAFGGAATVGVVGIVLLAVRARRPQVWLPLGLTALVVAVALVDVLFMAVLGIGSATSGMRIFRVLPITVGIAAITVIPLEHAIARPRGRRSLAIAAVVATTAAMAVATAMLEPRVNVGGAGETAPAAPGVAVAIVVAVAAISGLVLVGLRGIKRDNEPSVSRVRLGLLASGAVVIGLGPQIFAQAPELGDALAAPAWRAHDARPRTVVGTNAADRAYPQELVEALGELPPRTVVLADPATAWDIQGFAPLYSAGDYKHWLVPTRRNRPRPRYDWARRFSWEAVPDAQRVSLVSQLRAQYVLLNPDQKRARAFAQRQVDGADPLLTSVAAIDGWLLYRVTRSR